MKNRDYFLPSVTTLVLCGFVWFLSCAHQNRNREQFLENEDFSEVASFQPEQQEGSLSSEPEEGDESSAFGSTENNSFDSDAEKAFSTENEFSFSSESFSDSQEPSAFGEESSFEEETFGQDSTESAAAEAEVLMAPPTPTPTPSATPDPEESSQPEVPVSDSAEASLPLSNPEESTASLSSSDFKPVWIAKAPKIRSTPFEKKGMRLNRFYFVRKGDTPKKVAQLIYQNFSKSRKLVSWNGLRWTPGKVLYYSSPNNPDDPKMASFYQENQITPQEYRVRKGDSLSSIARKKLGHTKSWKEISVVNGIENPDSLEAGQMLAIYPKALKSQESSMVAQAPTQDQTTFSAPEPELAPSQPEVAPIQQPEQPSIQPQPSTPEPPPVAVAPTEQPRAEPQYQEPAAPVSQEAEAEMVSPSTEINWDQLVEQNFVAILIGAALIILLLALSARKKRKKAAASQDGDSSSEPKSRFGRR